MSLFLPGRFAPIPAGTFNMGAANLHSAGPVHRVTISKPFRLGIFPVTNDEFEQFAAERGVAPLATRYKGLNKGFSARRNPVVGVTYNLAQSYADWFNSRYQRSERVLGEGYFGLPTEAQWEYAARAGRTEAQAPFATSTGQLEKGLALYNAGNVRRPTSTGPVGQFASNPWGLHDMTGGVWEWVNDWHGAYTLKAQTDPVGPNSGQYRIMRGGSWSPDDLDYLRVAYRNYDKPTFDDDDVGFRIAFFPRIG